VKFLPLIAAALSGLAAVAAQADEPTMPEDMGVLALPLASGADEESEGVILVIGGGAREFTDSAGFPTGESTIQQRTYFRLDFMDSFSLGGSYSVEAGDAVAFGAADAVSLDASMNLDAWTFGVGWASGDVDDVFIDLGDGNRDVLSFTSSYAVRPGVRVNGLLEYRDDGSADPSNPSGDLAIGLGTLINF
jgi:hypothetical protein